MWMGLNDLLGKKKKEKKKDQKRGQKLTCDWHADGFLGKSKGTRCKIRIEESIITLKGRKHHVFRL
jgi:hypothetical protein